MNNQKLEQKWTDIQKSILLAIKIDQDFYVNIVSHLFRLVTIKDGMEKIVGTTMTSKSKSKGNGWEREVAKFLSETYNEPFIRTPHSGAYIGGENTSRKEILNFNQTKSFKGDIIPPDSWKKLNVECKNYGKFPFHQLLQGEIKQLEDWLKQLLEVEDPGDFNILIVKITRAAKFIVVESKHKEFNFADIPNISYVSSKYGKWVISEYDNFWKNNADTVKKLCS